MIFFKMHIIKHELLNSFDKFSSISQLKANKSKCEISGISMMKGIRLAVLSRIK